jgi:hypothetical protein
MVSHALHQARSLRRAQRHEQKKSDSSTNIKRWSAKSEKRCFPSTSSLHLVKRLIDDEKLIRIKAANSHMVD